MLAMVVNDDAGCLNERGAVETIASKLAPAGITPAAPCYILSQALCGKYLF